MAILKGKKDVSVLSPFLRIWEDLVASNKVKGKKTQSIYGGWLRLSFVEKYVFNLSEMLEIYQVITFD